MDDRKSKAQQWLDTRYRAVKSIEELKQPASKAADTADVGGNDDDVDTDVTPGMLLDLMFSFITDALDTFGEQLESLRQDVARQERRLQTLERGQSGQPSLPVEPTVVTKQLISKVVRPSQPSQRTNENE